MLQHKTFFVDRSLGRNVVVTALREHGLQAVAHDEVLAQETKDTEWIAECGRREWIILTKDSRIRTNLIEQKALLSARTFAFMLGQGSLTALAQANAFLGAMPRIEKVLMRFRVPVIASITVKGGVTLLWADGQRLRNPREIR